MALHNFKIGDKVRLGEGPIRFQSGAVGTVVEPPPYIAAVLPEGRRVHQVVFVKWPGISNPLQYRRTSLQKVDCWWKV